MAVARLRFLSNEEVELVHAKTLECLNEIGVKIKSESVLRMLENAGANVDYNSMIAKIPEGMIADAVKKAPKTIKLCGRDPKRDMQIPVSGAPYVATTGLGVYILDIETGKKRDSTRKDIADFIRLNDGLDAVDYVWTSLTATEVPQIAHGLHELWTAMQNTTKHVQGVSIMNSEDSKKQVELAALIAGGEDELRKRPLFSVIHCSIAPLMFDKGPVEGMVETVKAGIPVATMTMSLSGGTAPMTMAGTLVNANAENLASLVINQTAAPGSPTIYCSSSAPINMMTGVIDYMSANQCVIAAGLAQMAQRYGLPRMVGDWGVNDTPTPGIPHAFSEVMGVAMSMLSGTDLASGIGGLDAVKGAALEQAVIEAYLWEDVKGFMRIFDFNDETFALDVMKAVGHGNSFITHSHTAKHFRKELFFRDKNKMKWEATSSTAMVPEAKEVAKKILAEHMVPAIDRDIIARGDEIIRGVEKGSSQ